MLKLYDILQPWQQEFLKLVHENARTCGMIARQSGKSFICAFIAVESAVLDKQTWICISTGERQSQEWLKKAIKLSQYFQAFLRGTKLSFSFENNASEIRFSTGGRILAVPNNPDTLRGFTGNVIADECAFWENSYDVWQAIAPFLTSKYSGEKKVVVVSTPASKTGLFYDIFEKSGDFKKMKKTIFDVGKTQEEIVELKKNCIDDDIFRHEYCCEYLDGSSCLFSYELLRNSIWKELPKSPFKMFLGIDIGRTHDLTSIAFIKQFGKSNYVDHVETMKDKEFIDQEKYMSSIIASSNPTKVCIDSTGIGMQLAEDLKRKHKCIEPVNFTTTSKNEMFGFLKKQLGNELLLPNDNKIIEDMHIIKRIVSSNGNISYSADRDNNGHADMATSIALAARAASHTRNIFMPMNLY